MLRDGDADAAGRCGADRGLHRTGRWSPTSPALASTGWLRRGRIVHHLDVDHIAFPTWTPIDVDRPGSPRLVGGPIRPSQGRDARLVGFVLPAGWPRREVHEEVIVPSPSLFGTEAGFAQDPTTSVPGRGDRRAGARDGVAGGRSGDRRPVGPGDDGDTHIVGGTESPPGAWPSQAGVCSPVSPTGSRRSSAARPCCPPSWVLSAAHCARGRAGPPLRGRDILAETQDLTSGGRRVRGQGVPAGAGLEPGHLRRTTSCLIRLDRPVAAPAMPLIGRAASGRTRGRWLVTTGWKGNTSSSGSSFPTRLREVHVPYVADSTCRRTSTRPRPRRSTATRWDLRRVRRGPGGQGLVPRRQRRPHLPAAGGHLGAGRDPSSWGTGCATSRSSPASTPGSPVPRLDNRPDRYGPQPSSTTFVTQQYRDFLRSSAQPHSELEAAVA